MSFGKRIFGQLGITPEKIREMQKQAEESAKRFEFLCLQVDIILELLKLEYGTAKFTEAKNRVLERNKNE